MVFRICASKLIRNPEQERTRLFTEDEKQMQIKRSKQNGNKGSQLIMREPGDNVAN